VAKEPRVSFDISLISFAIEGCVDRFCGRPRNRNPYSQRFATNAYEAWDWGWAGADELLEVRGAAEARRWLEEAA
jgi:hypothetical protein